MKKILDIFIVLAVGVAVLVLMRNVVLKAAVENGVKAVTGMPLTVKKIDVGLAEPYLNIEGLVIKNPPGFHETTLAEIPKIFVAYDFRGILKGKLHFVNVDLNIEKFSVVRNEKGELNLDSLKALAAPKKPGTTPEPAPEKKEGKAPEIQIDVLRLRFGGASYVDYSLGGPVVKEFNVGLDETYRDITDPNKLVSLIVWKAMMKTPLAMLSGFNLGGLEGGLSDILGSTAGVTGQAYEMGKATGDTVTTMATEGASALTDAAKGSGQVATEAGETLKETAGAVTDSVKDAASSLKKLF